jgi:signal transduction histidine kinase
MQYVNLIHTSGQHLLNLINDLLDLSKVEAGRMGLDLQAVSPVDLCEQVLMLMQERAIDRNITLTFENQLPDRIKTALLDNHKVYQILVNLVSNAIKFTPTQGHVNPRLSLDKNSMLNFSVTDTGIGIPAEQQGKIFEAFYQVEHSMQRQTGGTGLGLALCRQFAKLMNAPSV